MLACGNGIEPTGKATTTDPRKLWRSYVFEVTLDGDVVWERLDNFQPEQPDATEVAESASEFVYTMNDGRILSTNDEMSGVGLMVLQAPTPL